MIPFLASCVPTNPLTSSGLSISPSAQSLVVSSSQEFVGSGGKAPYTFSATYGSLVVTKTSATYTAPATAVNDTIQMRDSAGKLIASAPITVYSKLATTVGTVQLSEAQAYTIPVSGGKAPYQYTIISGGGSLSGGVFIAPSVTGSTQIKITDALDQAVVLSTATTVVVAPTIQMLSGNYIPEAYATGCVPGVLTDFMETVSYNNRRVEPRNCAEIKIATPIFSWPLADNYNSSVPMVFTLTRVSDGTKVTISTLTPRILYPSALIAGTYEWTVKYTTLSNVAITSQARRFVIATSAVSTFSQGSDIANSVVLKSHPRTITAGLTFSQLATRTLNSEYKPAYNGFLARAATVVTLPIAAIPANLTHADFSNEVTYNEWTRDLRFAAIAEKEYIEILGYAYYFTNNIAYQTNAMNRILAIAAWPTNGATSEATQDQANREIYVALAIGLDLFQTQFTSTQRLFIVTALKDRLSQVMAKFSSLNRNPYDSHLLTAIQYTTEALLYAAGTPEFPEAKTLLATSWDALITTAGTWAGNDGAFGNGGAYGWYTLTTTARMMAAVKLVTDVDLSKLPAFGNFGYNQIAFYTANARIRGQFGDDVETSSHYFDYTRDSFRLLASLSGKGDYEWYWRAYPGNVTFSGGTLTPLHYLMLGVPGVAPSAPITTPVMSDSFLFEDAGFVAMHSKTTDTLRSSVFFRSSKLGAYNHSQADNNAFTFISKGKDILISGGYYPYYNSPHHALVGRGTRFKNTLTFDGGIGQAEDVVAPTTPGKPVWSMDARGKLTNFSDNGTWAVTTGDATLAYRGLNQVNWTWTPLLSNAIRSVAYNRQQGVIVIYDWATSTKARAWELNFQSMTLPTLIAGNTVQIVNGTSQGCINVYGPAGSFNITNGFPIAPEVTQPDQYHTRYNVSTASTELVSVTVIREDCKNIAVGVSFVGTKATINVNGSSIIADGRTIQKP